MFFITIRIDVYYFHLGIRRFVDDTLILYRSDKVEFSRRYEDDSLMLEEWEISHENTAMISRLVNLTRFERFRASYIPRGKRLTNRKSPEDEGYSWHDTYRLGIILGDGTSKRTIFKRHVYDTPKNLIGLLDQIIDLSEVKKHVESY